MSSVLRSSAEIKYDKPQTSSYFYIYIAIILTSFFYGYEYTVRTAPSTIIPELGTAFQLDSFGIGSLVGVFYYTYAPFAVIAGLLLDRFNTKFVLSAGFFACALGSILFTNSMYEVALLGRLFQGLGSAFGFVGCIYLASKYLNLSKLPIIIGLTQAAGMIGGTLGQAPTSYLIHDIGMSWQNYWIWVLGLIGLIITVLGLIFIPNGNTSDSNTNKEKNKENVLVSIKTILSNSQTWYSALISAFIFAPTTVFAMIFAIPYLTEANHLSRFEAATAVSCVPLGWILGSIIMGSLPKIIGSRKIPILFGIVGVNLCFLIAILNHNFDLTSLKITCFVMGVFSGSAMLPYGIAQNNNSLKYSGTTPGCVNLIVFGSSALLSQIVGALIGSDKTVHSYENAFLVLAFLLLISLFILKKVKDPNENYNKKFSVFKK